MQFIGGLWDEAIAFLSVTDETTLAIARELEGWTLPQINDLMEEVRYALWMTAAAQIPGSRLVQTAVAYAECRDLAAAGRKVN